MDILNSVTINTKEPKDTNTSTEVKRTDTKQDSTRAKDSVKVVPPKKQTTKDTKTAIIESEANSIIENDTAKVGKDNNKSAIPVKKNAAFSDELNSADKLSELKSLKKNESPNTKIKSEKSPTTKIFKNRDSLDNKKKDVPASKTGVKDVAKAATKQKLDSGELSKNSKETPVPAKKTKLQSDELPKSDKAKKVKENKATDSITTKMKSEKPLAKKVNNDKDSLEKKKREAPEMKCAVPFVDDLMKKSIKCVIAADKDRDRQIESERVIDEFHARNPEVLVFLEKCLKNCKNALRLQDKTKLTKTIRRQSFGIEPKPVIKRTLSFKGLGEEASISDIRYDSLKNDFSITIIAPVAGQVKVMTEQERLKLKTNKNCLLPKVVKPGKKN